MAEGFLFPFVTTTFSYVNGYYISTEGQPFVKFILLWMKRRKGLDVKNVFNVIDVLLVAVFGIFGFVGVLIYPIRK